MLTISGKAIGSRRALFSDFSVPPPSPQHGSEVTLRELIEQVVRHEVASFKERQHDRQFIRVLTEREISDGAAKGKIESGGSEVAPQETDFSDAVANALQAFQDGIYLVAIDEQQIDELDHILHLQPTSRVTFIRLTLLAGG